MNPSTSRNLMTPQPEEERGWKALLSRVMPQPANDARANAVDVLNQIRAPLAAMVDLSNKLIGSDLNDDQLRIARTLEATNHQLLAVINDLLDAQRLKRGSIKVTEARVDLKSVIDKALLVASGVPGAARLSISHEVDMWVPGHIMADPQRLLQVLTTLLGNAVSAQRGEDGEVRLRAWTDDKPGTPSLLQFAITDNGTPIHPEVRSRVFEPLVQHMQYAGHRPGLFVCRQVARAMGGDIELAATDNQRTCFIVKIPLKPAH